MHPSAIVHRFKGFAAQSRLTRVLFILAALVALGTFAPPALYAPPVPPKVTRVTFEPVPLDDENPRRRRVGALLYLGGWRLTSNDPRFGGISAMHVADNRVTAINDAGRLLRFGLRERGRGRAEVAQLPDGPGSPHSKRQRDTEAMMIRGGHAWVTFERWNQIWRYRLPGWSSDARASPAAMAHWRRNSGGEAIARLNDGRFLIVAEGRGGTTEALLFDGDPALPETPSRKLDYIPPEGYRPTDAATLPDGRLLVLNRRFSYLNGISAKLMLFEPPSEDTQVLEGREIAHFAPPLIVDNMEALSVARENGRTILWIGSDNNFMAIQQTLLLKFGLEDLPQRRP